jgi:hypothetical protein
MTRPTQRVDVHSPPAAQLPGRSQALRLARRLVDYTRHKPRCGLGQLPWRCTCGLEDLIRPLRPLDAEDEAEE